MATKAGVGMSRHHNPNVAGREAAEQALEKAGGDRPDFVFVFGSLGYDQRSLLRTVREAIGGAPLSGCSAEGTIGGDDADESGFSVVVTAISSDDLQWHNGSAAGLEADSRAVGQRVAQDLLPHLSTETIGLFVFPDGVKDFVVPTENLVDNFFGGLEENLPSERFLPMWGGGADASMNNMASPTYQYCDDEEKITTGFDRMASQIKNQLGGEKPKLVFQFECGTRGKMMFREQEKLQILRRFRQSLDPDAPWVGFYTSGEIGPVVEHNLRHLYTSVVLALS